MDGCVGFIMLHIEEYLTRQIDRQFIVFNKNINNNRKYKNKLVNVRREINKVT